MFIICPKCGAKYQIPPEISLNYGQKMQCSACEHYFVLSSENAFQKNESERIAQKSVYISESKEPPKQVLLSETQKTSTLPEAFQPSMPIVKRKSSILLPLLLVIVSFFILLLLLGLAWQYREEIQAQNQIETLHFNRSAPLRSEVQKPISQPISQVKMPESVEIFTPEAPIEVQEENFIEPVMEKPDFSFRSLRFQVLESDRGDVVQIEGIIKNEQNEPTYLPEVIYVNAYDTEGKVLFQKEIYFAKKSLMPNQEQAFFGTYSPAPKGIKWIDVSFQK